MTVAQYRELYRISQLRISDIDKTALSVCFYYGLTHDEVNTMHPKKFIRLSGKLVNKFKIRKPLFPSFRFNQNADSITFGQFVEIQQWLRMKKKDNFEDILVREIHMVAATILKNRKNHKKQSVNILKQNINSVFYNVYNFLQSYDQLINEFPFLFKEKEEEGLPKKEHYFQKSFGWIYAASTIATHNNIKLNDAYKLPIRTALNDLVFLKAKSEYDNFIMK